MTQPYSEYHRSLQYAFATILAEQLHSKDLGTIRRCLKLANPNITMGAPDQTKNQFRIEKDEAAKVLSIILREYL